MRALRKYRGRMAEDCATTVCRYRIRHLRQSRYSRLSRRLRRHELHGSPLPFPISNPVEPLAFAPGINVEHVFAFARILRRAVVGTLAPGFGGREIIRRKRISWQAAQEIDRFLDRQFGIVDAD